MMSNYNEVKMSIIPLVGIGDDRTSLHLNMYGMLTYHMSTKISMNNLDPRNGEKTHTHEFSLLTK